MFTGGAVLTLFWSLPPLGPNLPLGLGLPITSAALITTGYPIIKSGFNYYGKHKRPNYDLMVSAISLLSALAGKGYLGLLTLWLSTVSGYLQSLSLKLASNTFSNILIKKGTRISVLREGGLQHLLPGDVSPGDLAVFQRGDCVPVGLTALTTMTVVFNSARSLFSGGYNRHLIGTKGTFERLTTPRRKCFWKGQN